jgi:hypothetical protein
MIEKLLDSNQTLATNVNLRSGFTECCRKESSPNSRMQWCGCQTKDSGGTECIRVCRGEDDASFFYEMSPAISEAFLSQIVSQPSAVVGPLASVKAY